MSRASKLILGLFCFTIVVFATDDSVCDPASVEGVFKHLNFVNLYQNQFKEGIFWESTNPLRVNDDLDIIYFSEATAKRLDLNVDQLLKDEKCEQTLAEYLSGVRLIPGSKPISIPQTKWCWHKKVGEDSYSIPTNATNFNEILLGTIKTNTGNFDLILKGASLKHGSTSEKETPITIDNAIRQVILAEAIKAYNLKVVDILAVVGPRNLTKESNVVILQIAPTIISSGHIDHFSDRNTPVDFFRANDLITFLAKHVVKDSKIAPETYGNCFSDDDDDEQDDDEFCLRPNLDGFLSKIALAIYETTVKLHYKSILNGVGCSTDFGVDGTLLDLSYFRMQEPSNRPIVDCGASLVDGNIINLHNYFMKHTRDGLNTKSIKTRKHSFSSMALKENLYLPNVNDTFVSTLLARTTSSHFFFTVETAGFYRSLSGLLDPPVEPGSTPVELSYKEFVFTEDDGELARLKHLLGLYTQEIKNYPREERKEKMNKHNPNFVPREDLIFRSLSAVVKGNPEVFEEILKHLRNPYEVAASYPMRPKYRGKGPQIPCRPEDVPADDKYILIIKDKASKKEKDEL